MYVIQNVTNDTYWSNELGWVGVESADRFTEEEQLTLQLPTHSKWVTLWEVNSLQFARLIAECEAAGVFCDNDLMEDVADSMDLEVAEVFEIVERAQKAWDNYKAGL